MREASRTHDPASAAQDSGDATLERALVRHTFDLMRSGALGSAFAATLFTLGVATIADAWRTTTWAAVSLASILVNLAIHRAYATGRLGRSLVTHRAVRRLGVVATGLAWGAGGLLFPLRDELGPGFALVFCYAGLCAGAATTMAGDPLSYVLLCVTALSPDIVLAFPTLWWVSALLVTFVLVTTRAVVRNARALETSLALRIENATLLAQTVAEREAAISARARAERAAEAKTRFLAAASHDLRQPVQALSLFADVLARTDVHAHEARARAIAALARTTDALRAMVEGLLDVSRLDAGITVGAPVQVSLAPLLDEVVTALRDECETHGIVMRTRGRMATVSADPTLLARVLHNLASNAVRHARRGRVLIAVRHRAAGIEVQVWDQGRGIPEADRARVFDEYVQLDAAEREGRIGLGLGLPMVKRICALTGFTLGMRTRVDHGSMFSVTVPEASDVFAAVRTATPQKRALDVLLVEDDALVCEATVALLEAYDCAVHVAQNAQDARLMLTRLSARGAPPDVLVTDHRLPLEETGASLVRSLRASDETWLPAVLLTGDVDVPMLGLSEAEGVVVLRKPVSGDALFAAIERALGSRPAAAV